MLKWWGKNPIAEQPNQNELRGISRPYREVIKPFGYKFMQNNINSNQNIQISL